MNDIIAAEKPAQNTAALSAWLNKLKNGRSKNCLSFTQSTEFIKPQYVIQKLHEVTKGEAFVTSDVGQHQMWAAQYYPFDKPRRWIILVA